MYIRSGHHVRLAAVRDKKREQQLVISEVMNVTRFKRIKQKQCAKRRNVQSNVSFFRFIFVLLLWDLETDSEYCNTCPRGWTGYQNQSNGKRVCFKYITKGIKAGDASAICQNRGAKLPLPKNQEENDNLFNYAKSQAAFATRNEVNKV